MSDKHAVGMSVGWVCLGMCVGNANEPWPNSVNIVLFLVGFVLVIVSTTAWNSRQR